MIPVKANSVLSATFLLCHLLVRIGAYAIDHTCRPFSGDGQHKTPLITAAMVEARRLAENAAARVTDYALDGVSLYDNSRDRMFANVEHNAVRARFTAAVTGTPWVFNPEGRSLRDDRLTFYCGDDNFAPVTWQEPNLWGWHVNYIDMTSLLTFVGPPHGNDESARLCQPGYLARTLDASDVAIGTPPVMGDARIVVLCDHVLVGSARATAGELQAMQPGGTISSVGYGPCLAFTILHELFHVTQNAYFTRGWNEVYGWDNCAALSGDQALVNADSFAWYALAVSLPQDHFVYDGRIGEVGRALAGHAFVP